MTHFQAFSVTFPEVRSYRVASWLEKYCVFVILPFVFLLADWTTTDPYHHLSMVLLMGAASVAVTVLAAIERKRLSPLLNEKLRNELRARTGLVIPKGFPAVEQAGTLPLINSEGTMVKVNIERCGDEFLLGPVIG